MPAVGHYLRALNEFSAVFSSAMAILKSVRGQHFQCRAPTGRLGDDRALARQISTVLHSGMTLKTFASEILRVRVTNSTKNALNRTSPILDWRLFSLHV